MARIDSRHIRIFTGERLDASLDPAITTTREYSALMRRRRVRMRGHGHSGADEDTPSQVGDLRHCYTRSERPYHARDAGGSEPAVGGTESTSDVPSFIDDVVRSVITRTMSNVRRIAQLAQTIERFCTDSSVTCSGQWDLEIELNPEILPRTTLLMHVSPFVVRVRFHANHSISKQLICDYRPYLKRRLETTMALCGRACDIEVEIA